MSKNRKRLNEIYKKYKLVKEVHIFQSEDYTIITRDGIKNIQQQEGIRVTYELAYQSGNTVTVLAKGFYEGVEFQTYGEASPQNNTWTYPVAIAQKRAESRLILEMVGLYELMGSDEIKYQPARQVKTATEKGEKAADITLEMIQNIK